MDEAKKPGADPCPEKKGGIDFFPREISLFARLSSWIAAPVILGAFLGEWLDQKFGTSPRLFYVSVAAAFLASMLGLAREVMRWLKNQKNKDNDQTPSKGRKS